LRKNGEPFAYYETIAGGMGARPGLDGLDAIHTHMTNSLNTPIEVLESFYPVRVHRYGLRKNSGGAGRWRGGDGAVREVEFLADAQFALLADRRRFPPFGLAGGAPGKLGQSLWVKASGQVVRLPGKCTANARVGDRVVILTPGGGGWGQKNRKRK
jgi:N-methylhydantoinase B